MPLELESSGRSSEEEVGKHLVWIKKCFISMPVPIGVKSFLNVYESQTQLAINNMIASYELKFWDFLIWPLVIEDLCKIMRSIVSCESKFLDFLIEPYHTHALDGGWVVYHFCWGTQIMSALALSIKLTFIQPFFVFNQNPIVFIFPFPREMNLGVPYVSHKMLIPILLD